MITFLLAAGSLTLAVIALLAPPLLRPRRASGPDQGALNARLLRDEVAALEAEHARGALDGPAFAQQRAELARRVLEDVGGARPLRVTLRHAGPTLGALLLLLPLAGALLYVLLGTPGALGAAGSRRVLATQEAPQGAQASPQVQDMVSSLASRLAAHPDDPKGWAMLGRSYSVLGRFQDAVSAYARVGPSLRTHADWLAEYADALAMSAGGDPVGRPEAMARRALAIDPDNLLALMLAGYAASRRGDDATARQLLLHARREVTPGTEDAAFVDNLLQQVRARLGEAPGDSAEAAQASATADRAKPAGGATSAAALAPAPVLRVVVDVAPALRADAAHRTLFVIARQPGKRTPVAAVKRTAAQFPLRLSLSDADSMVPNQPLSQAGVLEVEARLSAHGDAMPARGDDYGIARVDAQGLATVSVDQRRP